MAVVVDIAPFTTLEAAEEKGALVRLVRQTLVTGLTDAAYTNLWEALDDIDGAGFTVGTVLTEEANLILTNRRARVVGNSPSKVEVTLEYLRQGIDSPNGVILGGSSLRQITSEKDFFGVQITTSHTYPDTDEEFGGETLTQGSPINPLYPQMTLRGIVRVQQDFPHLYASEWIGHVNSTQWAGLNAGKMIVSNVQWMPFDFSTTPKTWEFTFEFQGDPRGWQPSVFFVDPRTGKPPVDLVAGTGTKTVSWYPTRDFNTVFPNTDVSP
jgi:hypothetical protein